MGSGHAATWFAVGVEQHLDTLKKKHWAGYVGLGRKSYPDSYLPYQRAATVVVDQEFHHHFHRHWKYSLALSFREHDEYRASAPYDHATPGMKQEIRVYGRFSYVLSRSTWKLVATLRQDVRKFYTPDFVPWNLDVQLRTRFRSQAILYLDRQKNTRLTASCEQLFATSRTSNTHHWGPFRYTDSRFGLFLSKRPGQLPFVFSVGYMNDLLERKDPRALHFLALSAVWQNPFGPPKNNRRNGSSGPNEQHY